MVATLFYKSKTDRISNTLAPYDRSPEANSGSVLPANLAPTTSLSSFPLEPPPPDPEPLDHLYGSYVSPLCITSFLHLLTSFPLPQGSTSLTSSHRCLDDPNHPRVVEITFSPAPDPVYLTVSDLRKHELLYRFEREWNIDIVLQRDTPLRRYPRLVVFDMDSTLIEQEVIDLIAASIGVEPQVSAITARAMNGELDFAASLRERVALLKGVNANIFTDLRSVITPTKGAKELIHALKHLGVKTAVLSGGFIPLTQWLADELGIDYAYANTLSSVDGKLTGEVSGPIVDATRKASLLLEIAAKHQVDRSQVIAVGDGANDLLMMKEAAMGVAFNAKPLVQLEAAARLNGESLLDLLFLLGLTGEEVGVLVR
jgi:phosphoserine phosphatase